MSSRRYFASGEKRTQLRTTVTSSVDAVDQAAQVREAVEVYLTPEEVQVRLQLPSVKRVYDLIHQHGLPSRRVGRLLRIEQGEFQAWTKASREGDGQRVSRPHLVRSR